MIDQPLFCVDQIRDTSMICFRVINIQRFSQIVPQRKQISICMFLGWLGLATIGRTEIRWWRKAAFSNKLEMSAQLAIATTNEMLPSRPAKLLTHQFVHHLWLPCSHPLIFELLEQSPHNCILKLLGCVLLSLSECLEIGGC